MKGTHIEFLRDSSGSMADIKAASEEGLKALLEKYQEVVDCTFSLTDFDYFDGIQLREKYVNVSPRLVDVTLTPGGSTPLYDAICSVIDSLGQKLANLDESKRPEKIFFVIQTDGLENTSRKFSLQDVKDRIQHQSEKYGWHFIFLGANQDAVLSGTNMGIPLGASITYTSQGTRSVFTSVTGQILSVVNNASVGIAFTGAERGAAIHGE